MFTKLFKKNSEPTQKFLNELLKKNSDTKILEKLLEDININEINDEGDSYLHICLKKKKTLNALWLISKNINLDIKNNNGDSAFDLAINNQNHKIVSLLLKKIKVDLNKTNEFGRTLLQDSVILGDHAMAKLLIQNGADINIKNNKNRNVFYDALSYNNDDFTNYLLDLDALELDYLDIEKNSIFDHKSVKDNNDLAKKLIDKGASPIIQNRKAESFLAYCALNGADGLEMINYALQKGFDINSKVKNNDTLLMVLVDELLKLKNKEDEDKRKVLRYLIKELILKGLDINATTKENESVLFKAVRQNDLMLVQLLLSLKININKQNDNKQTALAIAVYQGMKGIKTTVELLKHHADPTIKNFENKCLFEEINDMIIDINYPKEAQILDNQKLKSDQLSAQFIAVLKELLKYTQKNLNYLDSSGNPLFYKPIMHHNIPLFYLYTNKGLDIHNLNKHGHNLFFEYLLKVFEDDNINIDFQGVLNILMSFKINHNKQDETGWTAISKVIATTPCNISLFKTLVKIIKFDYSITDKLGRSAMHSAVWKGNSDIVKIINFIDPQIKNNVDNYGILPITYAALLGNQELVLTFIEQKSKSTTDFYILPAAIKKFSPMLNNLDKLNQNIGNHKKVQLINAVIKDIKDDFNLENRDDI